MATEPRACSCAVGDAAEEAPAEARADVAHLVELVPQPALLETFGVAEYFVAGLAFDGEVGKQRLGGLDARLHRHVGALDLGHVEEARGVADQHAAREAKLGHRLEATLVERPRAVGDAPASLEDIADLRVGLETLELLVGRQVRVAVIQPDHEAHRHLVVLEVVQEGAAIHVGGHRPAHGVHREALLVHLGAHLPQLLDADAVGLRVAVGTQPMAGFELLAQVSATAFGKQGVGGVQRHARLMGRAGHPFAGQADVPGGHAHHGAGLVVQHLGTGKARVDLDPQGLGLLAEPAHHVAETHDVVAIVGQAIRQQGMGNLAAAALLEQEYLVFPDGGVQRCAQGLPVGQEFFEGPRVHHRARQDVGPHFGALLDHADGDLAPGGGRLLLEPDRRRQPRRAAADDHNIVFHRIAIGTHGHSQNRVSARPRVEAAPPVTSAA